jgi:hypothetical protein
MASFCYGREDIIPDMFRQLIRKLSSKDPNRWRKLEYYFKEHIDCDENRHGPMARLMIERHCGSNQVKWEKVKEFAIEALMQRKDFWDDILDDIKSKD